MPTVSKFWILLLLFSYYYGIYCANPASRRQDGSQHSISKQSKIKSSSINNTHLPEFRIPEKNSPNTGNLSLSPSEKLALQGSAINSSVPNRDLNAKNSTANASILLTPILETIIANASNSKRSFRPKPSEQPQLTNSKLTDDKSSSLQNQSSILNLSNINSSQSQTDADIESDTFENNSSTSLTQIAAKKPVQSSSGQNQEIEGKDDNGDDKQSQEVEEEDQPETITTLLPTSSSSPKRQKRLKTSIFSGAISTTSPLSQLVQVTTQMQAQSQLQGAQSPAQLPFDNQARTRQKISKVKATTLKVKATTNMIAPELTTSLGTEDMSKGKVSNNEANKPLKESIKFDQPDTDIIPLNAGDNNAAEQVTQISPEIDPSDQNSFDNGTVSEPPSENNDQIGNEEEAATDKSRSNRPNSAGSIEGNAPPKEIVRPDSDNKSPLNDEDLDQNLNSAPQLETDTNPDQGTEADQLENIIQTTTVAVQTSLPPSPKHTLASAIQNNAEPLKQGEINQGSSKKAKSKEPQTEVGAGLNLDDKSADPMDLDDKQATKVGSEAKEQPESKVDMSKTDPGGHEPADPLVDSEKLPENEQANESEENALNQKPGGRGNTRPSIDTDFEDNLGLNKITPKQQVKEKEKDKEVSLQTFPPGEGEEEEDDDDDDDDAKFLQLDQQKLRPETESSAEFEIGEEGGSSTDFLLKFGLIILGLLAIVLFLKYRRPLLQRILGMLMGERRSRRYRSRSPGSRSASRSRNSSHSLNASAEHAKGSFAYTPLPRDESKS